jgi:trehalose 6-phosphate synthase/phosphatase
MDKFYLGFCNKTIWPLFHYFPSFAEYEGEFWEVYQTVNQLFCEHSLTSMSLATSCGYTIIT